MTVPARPLRLSVEEYFALDAAESEGLGLAVPLAGIYALVDLPAEPDGLPVGLPLR